MLTLAQDDDDFGLSVWRSVPVSGISGRYAYAPPYTSAQIWMSPPALAPRLLIGLVR